MLKADAVGGMMKKQVNKVALMLWLGAVVVPPPALAGGLPPAPNGDLTYGYCPTPPGTDKADGVTELSFDGTQDGALANVTVKWSSANPDLDKAAQSCVSQWHFSPGTKRGQRWLGHHSLTIDWTTKGADRPYGKPHVPHVCWNFPEMAQIGGISGEVLIRFTISEEGDVTDPSIAKSSGNADLDKAALHCVASWTYRPILKGGKPTAVPFETKIVWHVTTPGHSQ